MIMPALWFFCEASDVRTGAHHEEEEEEPDACLFLFLLTRFRA